MSALVLVPWAHTAWTASGRFAARTQLPLTEEGRKLAASWGRALGVRKLQCVYTSDEQTARETAEAVASAASTRVRTLDGIEEVGCGLWEGLTEETIKSRFPKAHKRWKEDPTSVCPPEGESIADAAERLRKALRTAQRKAERGDVGIVLGPVALAIARCELAAAPLSGLREFISGEPVRYTQPAEVLEPVAPDRTK